MILIATSYMCFFKLELKKIKEISSGVALVTFQMFSSHLRLVATADIEISISQSSIEELWPMLIQIQES